MFGGYRRRLDNYTRNFVEYSCYAPTEGFKNCDGECGDCDFAEPRYKQNIVRYTELETKGE